VVQVALTTKTAKAVKIAQVDRNARNIATALYDLPERAVKLAFIGHHAINAQWTSAVGSSSTLILPGERGTVPFAKCQFPMINTTFASASSV